MNKFILLLSFFVTNSFAFTKGSGSEFIFQADQKTFPLSIYLTEVSNQTLGVEFHFAINGLLMKSMWQQFRLTRQDAAISIVDGYLKTGKNKSVEKMTKEHFEINNGKGVEIHQFLFSNSKTLESDFIGNENLEVAAGPVIAKHYRKSKNGQIVDFWISDIVKPIGLVKLISKNTKKASQNYSIELSSLLKNVAAEINPSEAKPMSKKSNNILIQAIQK